MQKDQRVRGNLLEHGGLLDRRLPLHPELRGEEEVAKLSGGHTLNLKQMEAFRRAAENKPLKQHPNYVWYPAAAVAQSVKRIELRSLKDLLLKMSSIPGPDPIKIFLA